MVEEDKLLFGVNGLLLIVFMLIIRELSCLLANTPILLTLYPPTFTDFKYHSTKNLTILKQ